MDEFLNFIKQFPLRHFAKGETIPTERDGKALLHGIQQGYARVYSVNATGDEQFVWIAGRLDIVPSEMLFSPRAQGQFFYSALSDMDAYEIDKKAFLTYAKSSIDIMSEVARSMSQHYDDLLLRVRATEQSSAREKLIYTLHYMAIRFSAEPSVSFHDLGLFLTHHDISRLVGTTRETTAIEMKKLKDEGYIDYGRNTLVIHSEKLETLL